MTFVLVHPALEKFWVTVVEGVNTILILQRHFINMQHIYKIKESKERLCFISAKVCHDTRPLALNPHLDAKSSNVQIKQNVHQKE